MFFFQAPEVYDLVWHPKPGGITSYRVHVDMNIQGSNVDIAADLRMTVRKVAANGNYEVETTTKNVRVTTDYRTEKVPDEAAGAVDRFDKTGRRLTLDNDPDDSLGNIMGPATDFIAPPGPVKPGERWQRLLPADPKLKRRPMKLDYQFVGPTKSGLLRVTYKFAETAGAPRASGIGTFLLSPRDAAVLSYEGTLKNVVVSEDTLPGTVTITLRKP